MSKIHTLSQQLINQIKAGEIIERPSSVVKEVVENALDAGATQIDIDIENGGGKLICVRDNGSGIDRDDMARAFENHATSKIRELDDLERLRTLGFRGEALPSVAAVAKVLLVSRTEQEEHGYSINPADPSQLIPTAHPRGTTIEVRDLFYNTPARKRFLKSMRTETNHVVQLVERFALSNAHVQFLLRDNGRISRDFRGDMSTRMAKILGKEFLKNAIPVENQMDSVSLRGWIGLPAFDYSTTDKQHVFLNGRIIRDKFIQNAINDAYQDFMGHFRLPVYVLYLDVEPELFDVNAHPNKYEVRFRDNRQLHDFIFSTLRQALHVAVPVNPRPPTKPEVAMTTGASGHLVPDMSVELEIPPPPPPRPKGPPRGRGSKPALGQALCQLGQSFMVTANQNGLVLVDLVEAARQLHRTPPSLTLTLSEMNQLLRLLEALPPPRGRTAWVQLSTEAIGKLFQPES